MRKGRKAFPVEEKTPRHLEEVKRQVVRGESVAVDSEYAKHLEEVKAKAERGEPIIVDAEYAKCLGAWTAYRDVGAMIRELRQSKGISLRSLAMKVGVTPGYISFLERNTIKSPPTERLIRRIARILEANEDEMLALAGRVSSDLVWGCAKHPRQMAALLRGASSLREEEIDELARKAREMVDRGKGREKEA